jgi:hypothetical protein
MPTLSKLRAPPWPTLESPSPSAIGHLRSCRSRHRVGACICSSTMLFRQHQHVRFTTINSIRNRCEMATQILPAASLRNASRLPAPRALVRAAYYLICIALCSMGRAIFRVAANYLPALREGALPRGVERGADRPADDPGASKDSSGFTLCQASRSMPASHPKDAVDGLYRQPSERVAEPAGRPEPPGRPPPSRWPARFGRRWPSPASARSGRRSGAWDRGAA